VLDRLELTTLGALEVVDRSGDLVALLDGSAPGGIPVPAGSPPSAGTPRLACVATGADTHSVHADRLADVVAFRCNPDPSCGQDGAA
jgi:hypothetical protein